MAPHSTVTDLVTISIFDNVLITELLALIVIFFKYCIQISLILLTEFLGRLKLKLSG